MKTSVLNVKIDSGMNMTEVISYLNDSIANKIYRHVCTTNPEFIMSAQHNPEFMEILNASDLSLPDGSGVLYALAYLKRVEKLNRKSPLFKFRALLSGITLLFLPKSGFGEKIIGVSLFLELCKLSAEHNYTVFLLGGRVKNALGKASANDVDLATACKIKLEALYPNIRIIGATSKFDSDEKDDDRTLDYIHDCMKKAHVDHIDLMFVAYNHPKQDMWLSRNRMKIPAIISMAVGGTFDYVTGTKSRPPKVIIDMNLEWLYRLFTQPWRIKRIYTAFPLFPIKVYKSIIK